MLEEECDHGSTEEERQEYVSSFDVRFFLFEEEVGDVTDESCGR